MIKAIFFATFDVDEGPKVHHQVPASSIVPTPLSPSIPLFHFPSISNYLIPHPTLCSQSIHLLTPHHRILSHPMHLTSPHYPRNAYTFSFNLVLANTDPFHSHLPIVYKLAALFHTLEEQSRFLSSDTSPPNTGRIYALCEILLEDLNNYCESMIPIDESNTLNIKLFPTYPPPPPLYAWHVPLSTVRLDTLADDNWDLTMLRILPHIDGVNSVAQIALRADADFKLARKAIRHLLYYGCLILLDVFSFGAVYATTAEISQLVEDEAMQEECARYVTWPTLGTEGMPIGNTRLVELYLSLRQGLSVKNWCLENKEVLSGIDVRRFVTFGVVKGFLYRVHKYAFAMGKGRKGDERREGRRGRHDREKGDEKGLGRFLDGTHCFDEICTELMISEKELMEELRARGDVQVICR